MITQSFNFTGTPQTWVVPIGVSTVTVEVWGASGGGRVSSERSLGGYVKATMGVAQGQTIDLYVGGMGTTAGGGYGAAGGFAGGNPGRNNGDITKSYGGGGASVVARTGTPLIVAGGGGGSGAGSNTNAPVKGGDGGVVATAGVSAASGGGGGGATGTAGGAAGASGTSAGGDSAVSTAGTSTSAGNGGDQWLGGTSYANSGGGGGGGHYGGGGGGRGLLGSGTGGGGGGGSSMATGGNLIQAVTGARGGDGRITISYNELPPSTPTNVTPAAGAIINLDNPTLGARFTTTSTQAKARVQWQLATDAGFTQNLRTYTQPETMLTTGGTAGVLVSYVIGSTTGDQRRTQGTWYIRARTIDANNVASGFTGAQSFRVEFPPTTINHYPTGNVAIQHISTGITLAWDFISVSANVDQSAYQVVVEQNSGVPVADTGKVISSESQSVVAVPTELKGTQLRWRVRVWDTDNVMGPYSDYHLFRTADVPVVAITSMTTVTTSNPTVSFNVTPVGNAPIAQRRLYITRDSDNAIVFDSGWR
jgi:hypothetical protein